MGFKDSFRNAFIATPEPVVENKSKGVVAISNKIPEIQSYGILKAYVPEFLYKPPYGYPRKANCPFLRQLALTPYVFSVKKTLCDEASSLEWEVRIKEDVEDPESWEEELKNAQKFFNNPNSNKESWEHLQRALFGDMIELDSGVGVKVFNQLGEFIQLYARDGASFLMNPNIHGTFGNRADLILPINDYFTEMSNRRDPISGNMNTDLMTRQYYDVYSKDNAAYFQYGWTGGSMPVPFGKREIMYLMANARTDSIYGRSPVEILGDVIMTLHYGSKYHLDFYTNSNIPEGMVQMKGIQDDVVTATQEKFKEKFTVLDALDNQRRVGHHVPFTNAEEVKFVPFTLSPKEMMIIEQQEWFVKILWMNFGVTPDEMGITENSNRATSGEQGKVFKRKAIRPLCKKMKYGVDMEILPEFVIKRFGGDWEKAVDGCPLEFIYKDYDVEEDIKKHTVMQMEINMGVKTPEMVAKDLGINIDELQKSKDEQMKRNQEMMSQGMDENGKPLKFEEENDSKDNKDDKKNEEFKKEKKKSEVEDKSGETEFTKEIDDEIKQVGKMIDKLVSVI